MVNDEQRTAPAPGTIEPRAFHAAGPAMPEPAAARVVKSRGVLALVATCVAALVLLLAFALPRWLAPPPPAPLPAAPLAPTAPASLAPPTVEAPVRLIGRNAPAARQASQAMLALTLAKLAKLAGLREMSWARAALHAIDLHIDAGEKAYREQRYGAAEDSYRSAQTAIDALQAQIPGVVAAAIDAGNLALDNGDSATASAAFTEALALAPDSAPARSGLARAATLDQVLALSEQAAGYERMQQADRALAAYREALLIDAATPGAAAAIARLERGMRALDLQGAMSDGFAALARQDFAGARAALARAAAIDGNAAEVRAAQAQVEHAATAAAIAQQFSAAKAAAAAERWTDARQAYARVLTLDPELTEARSGRDEAERRAALDAALGAYLARPERLADEAVHAEASGVLAKARAPGLGGKRLAAQSAALAEALRVARIPVAIALQSDGQTAVTVNRYGALGQFEQRRIELLPGTYTAIGTRDGYRDVRVEFIVAPAATAPVITVLCVEKFRLGS